MKIALSLYLELTKFDPSNLTRKFLFCYCQSTGNVLIKMVLKLKCNKGCLPKWMADHVGCQVQLFTVLVLNH